MADTTEAKTTSEVAIDRIRETAKWLTLSLAGLGAVLVAGSQLSDLGSLEPWTIRFWAAIIGTAVAVAGTALILWLAIWIATTPLKTFTQIVTDKDNDRKNKSYKDLLTNTKALGGEKDVTELGTRYDKARENLEEARTAYEANQGNVDLRAKAMQAQADFLLWDKVIYQFTMQASYRHLARRWRRVGGALIAAGVVVAMAVATFAWAANPPPDATASVVTPAVLTAPMTGTLTLTNAGKEALQGTLGSDCALTGRLTVLVLGRTDAGPDVLVQQSRCATTRFIVVPAWGSVTGA